jgi:hypothetical protein
MFRFFILTLLSKGFLFGKNPSFEAFWDTHCVNAGKS